MTVCSDTFMVEASDFLSQIEDAPPVAKHRLRALQAEMAARTAYALAISAQSMRRLHAISFGQLVIALLFSLSLSLH